MRPMVRPLFSLLVIVSLAGLSGCECQPADPAPGEPLPEPQAGEPKAQPARPDGLYASPHRMGPLSVESLPTLAAIRDALPEKYAVREAGAGVFEGATVEVMLGEEVILEITPSADGTKIERAVARGGHVVFPWNTKVGMLARDQKNWARMTCVAAPAPFTGHAMCNAFAEGRIGYLLKGWEGDPNTLPERDVIEGLPIVGMIWTPGATGPDPKPKKPKSDAPQVIQMVPVEE